MENIIDKSIETMKEVFAKEPKDEEVSQSSIKLRTPQHIAFTMEGIIAYAKKHNIPFAQAYQQSFLMLKNLLAFQTKRKIPIITVLILPANRKKEGETFSALMEGIKLYLQELKQHPLIHKHKIKISVLGKWYDLPGSIVDAIKEVLNETKDYDNYFFNLCINYHGQEEIVDAVKLIARQIKAEKLDPELITKEIIKENLYSSYFVPPDIVIKTGLYHTIPGVLLWDIVYARIYYTDKYWPELKVSDILRAIKRWQE